MEVKKPLLIMGASPLMKDDFQRFGNLYHDNVDLLAVGMDVMDRVEQDIRFFATYHVKDIPLASKRRMRMGYNMDYKIISHIPYPKSENNIVDFIVPIDLDKEKSGSSAMLGCLAGIEIGYTKIVLCGCPLEGKSENGLSYKQFQKGWVYHQKKVQGIVKSMSGWTMGFLGEPTKEWMGK